MCSCVRVHRYTMNTDQIVRERVARPWREIRDNDRARERAWDLWRRRHSAFLLRTRLPDSVWGRAVTLISCLCDHSVPSIIVPTLSDSSCLAWPLVPDSAQPSSACRSRLSLSHTPINH